MHRLPRKIPSATHASFSAQRGFLLVTAVTLIVVAALLVAVMVFFTAAGSHSSARNQSAKQALYIAGTGLERGTRSLLSPVLAERVSCNAVSGNANLTDVAFGAGRFTVTGGAPDYSGSTVLNLAITATDDTIPIVDATGYASRGRVLIDRETIDYSAVEPADDTICGGVGRAPCLVGAQRGQDGTVAASHASGTPVGQYQCDLQAQGGVPDLVNVRGKRTLQQSAQLQEGWIVGDRLNGGPAGWCLLRWDGPANADTWVVEQGAGNAQSLRAVSMLNYADGWAVGNSNGTRPVVLRWNTPCAGGAGTGVWNNCTNIPGMVPAINQNLNSVSMLSATDGWAAGNSTAGSNTGWFLLHWNGSVWTLFNSTSPPMGAQNLNAVYMVSGADGWAVGSRNGTRPVVLRWNTPCGGGAATGAWNNCTNVLGMVPAINRNLNSVSMLSATDGWAVGNSGGGTCGAGTNNRALIMRWNGAAWNCMSSPASRNLNGIYMTSTTDGWAVGRSLSGATNGWNFVHWDGAAWSPVTVNTPGTGAQDLYAIECATTNDCWAAGNNGAVLHWDGTSWTSIAIAGVSQALRSVSMISHQGIARSAWREVFQ